MSKPKEAQFYARLNADDAWKHKYKQFCFSWTQGTPIKERSGEFAFFDGGKAAQQVAIEAAKRIHLAQVTELARRRSEHTRQLQERMKQQEDEANAVSILSAFAFASEAKDASDRETMDSTSSVATNDADETAISRSSSFSSIASNDDSTSTLKPQPVAREDKQARKRQRSAEPLPAPVATCETALSHLSRVAAQKTPDSACGPVVKRQATFAVGARHQPLQWR